MFRSSSLRSLSVVRAYRLGYTYALSHLPLFSFFCFLCGSVCECANHISPWVAVAPCQLLFQPGIGVCLAKPIGFHCGGDGDAIGISAWGWVVVAE